MSKQPKYQFKSINAAVHYKNQDKWYWIESALSVVAHCVGLWAALNAGQRLANLCWVKAVDDANPDLADKIHFVTPKR